MSAPEAAVTPVAAVEEVKPAESVPAPEPSVPAVEAPKPEETTVRHVLCLSICFSLTLLKGQGYHQGRACSSKSLEIALALRLTNYSSKESATEPSTNPEPQSEASPTVAEEAKVVCIFLSVKSVIVLFTVSRPRPRPAPQMPRRRIKRAAPLF